MFVAAYSFQVAVHNKLLRYSHISSNVYHTAVAWSILPMFETGTVEKWMTCFGDYCTDYSNDRILDIQFHYISLYYPVKRKQRMISNNSILKNY